MEHRKFKWKIRTLCQGGVHLPPMRELWPYPKRGWRHPACGLCTSWMWLLGVVTIHHLRRQCPLITVYNESGELLTSMGDIVRWWIKYFKDVLNPTDTPFVKRPRIWLMHHLSWGHGGSWVVPLFKKGIRGWVGVEGVWFRTHWISTQIE